MGVLRHSGLVLSEPLRHKGGEGSHHFGWQRRGSRSARQWRAWRRRAAEEVLCPCQADLGLRQVDDHWPAHGWRCVTRRTRRRVGGPARRPVVCVGRRRAFAQSYGMVGTAA